MHASLDFLRTIALDLALLALAADAVKRLRGVRRLRRKKTRYEQPE